MWEGKVGLGEELLDSFVGYHLFLEDVSARLRGLDHLDYLRVGTAVRLLERCDCFLCHCLISLLDFLVDSHALEDRIVLLQLKTLSGVLTILRRDIAGSPG